MEYNIEEILEMYEDDFNPDPRPMAQEPRNMYAGGQLVRNTNNGSRPGYKGDPLDGYDRATRKLDKGVTKISSERVSSKIMKHIYKDKATGNEIEVFKVKITDQPSNKGGKMKSGKGGNYKTLLSKEFSTLEEAVESRDNYYKENPGKRVIDPTKKSEAKKKRRENEKLAGGDEKFKAGNNEIQKGHSTNIEGKNKIKPKNIIYTPTDINSKMGGKAGSVDAKNPSSLDSLDLKQRNTEAEIEKIKKSKLPAAEKKRLLAIEDNKLMRYVAQSDGYKTAVLSDGGEYGTNFRSLQSQDMFNEFPNMTEKQVKEFVGEYFTQKGDLKPKYKNAKDLSQSVQDNIVKAYMFNENVKNAQTNATKSKKVMAFCPAGTAKVTKAGGGRVPYADGPVCTPEEAVRGMNEEIEKIKKGKASAGESSRTVNKLKNLGSLGMRGLVKAGLVSEVLFEAALGFDKVVSEGQSPMQAFRQSYLTAPLRGLGVMKSFEEGEKEEILAAARDKGKVGRVLDLQKLVADKNKLANKIESLKDNLTKVKSIDGNSFMADDGNNFMAEKNISDAKAELQDMRRSGELTRAEQLFSTKPQDLKIKDQSLMDAYNNAIEKRKNIAAEKGLIAQSKAADRNRLRDRMKAEGILTTQDAKNELQNIGDYYGQGFTPYGMNKLYEYAGMQNPGFGIEKVGPRTGKYNEEKGLQEYLDSMRTQQIADAGGVANMANGGIANLMKKYYD